MQQPEPGPYNPPAAPHDPSGAAAATLLGSYPGAEAGQGVLAGPGGAPPRRRPTGVLVALALAAFLVLALVGGGAVVATRLVAHDTGGPEDHVPSSAAALVTVDLDPPLEQKLDAVRFLMKVPQLGDGLSERSDLRRWVYERLTEDESTAPPYAEVEAWLGDELAVAAVPSGDEAKVLVLLEVTDDVKAQASLKKLAAEGDGGAYLVRDGWATLAEDRADIDDALAQIKKGSLSDSATFRADMKRLGDRGMATAWYDAGALAPLAAGQMTSVRRLGGGLLGGGTKDVSGHGVVTLRFDGPQLELAGDAVGARRVAEAGAGGTGVELLPRDSVVALGAAGMGRSLTDQWPALRRQLDATGASTEDLVTQLEGATGLKLPGDLPALLGERVTVGVGGPDDSGVPSVGVRVTTESDRASAVVDGLRRVADQADLSLHEGTVTDGWVLATSRSQAGAMSRDGGLGDNPRFTSVVPDAKDATAVLFVDLAALARTYPAVATGGTGEVLTSLDVLGISAHQDNDRASFSIRVGSR